MSVRLSLPICECAFDCSISCCLWSRKRARLHGLGARPLPTAAHRPRVLSEQLLSPLVSASSRGLALLFPDTLAALAVSGGVLPPTFACLRQARAAQSQPAFILLVSILISSDLPARSQNSRWYWSFLPLRHTPYTVPRPCITRSSPICLPITMNSAYYRHYGICVYMYF